jgi:glycosyltransferase EpsH
LIGLGLVLIHPSVPRRDRKRDIRAILCDPLYRNAVKQLNIKSMPAHWKLFFLFAKWNWTGGVYALLQAIKYLKRRM